MYKRQEYTLRAGYEITERTIDKYGQFNLVPDIEVEAWWTNLGDPDEEIISLYHAHGECEQFHSEVKTDMDLERLPSGKFATNALILELGMIAYNILRMIGQGTIGGLSLIHIYPFKAFLLALFLRKGLYHTDTGNLIPEYGIHLIYFRLLFSIIRKDQL